MRKRIIQQKVKRPQLPKKQGQKTLLQRKNEDPESEFVYRQRLATTKSDPKKVQQRIVQLIQKAKSEGLSQTQKFVFKGYIGIHMKNKQTNGQQERILQKSKSLNKTKIESEELSNKLLNRNLKQLVATWELFIRKIDVCEENFVRENLVIFQRMIQLKRQILMAKKLVQSEVKRKRIKQIITSFSEILKMASR